MKKDNPPEIKGLPEETVSPSALVVPDALQISPDITAARLGLGRVGAGMPTKAVLGFALDHARARDAVLTPLDFERLTEDCSGLGLGIVKVESASPDRQTYLRRPDFGRRLSEASRADLAGLASGRPDVVITVGDGLSSIAVQNGTAELLSHLVPRLQAMGLSFGPVVLASQARVALSDEVGEILGARMSIMLVGERPGLSAADSLGAYLTLSPKLACTDADRNCISNIRPGGLTPEAAAFKLTWLVDNAFRKGVSGVQLKDESDVGGYLAGSGSGAPRALE